MLRQMNVSREVRRSSSGAFAHSAKVGRSRKLRSRMREGGESVSGLARGSNDGLEDIGAVFSDCFSNA